jgi:hypothetical protein
MTKKKMSAGKWGQENDGIRNRGRKMVGEEMENTQPKRKI